MESWYLLNSGENLPEFNMALDEAMLDYSYQNSIPILRFYKWKPPTLSIGYFQKTSSSVNFEELKNRGFAFIRRPTGGRAVLHNKEITYSITLPISHKFLELSVIESYEILCKPIVKALNDLNIKAYLSNEDDKEINSPSCFAAPTFMDIKVKGKKLIGSAQTRDKRGLLQHGSILLDVDVCELFSVLNINGAVAERLIKKGREKITSLSEEGFKENEDELKSYLIKAYKDLLEIDFKPLEISSVRNINEYMLKYSSKEWNFRI